MKSNTQDNDNSCAVISAILTYLKFDKQATKYLCLTELKRCSSLPHAEQKLSRCRESDRERTRKREVCARTGKAKPHAHAAVPAILRD